MALFYNAMQVSEAMLGASRSLEGEGEGGCYLYIDRMLEPERRAQVWACKASAIASTCFPAVMAGRESNNRKQALRSKQVLFHRRPIRSLPHLTSHPSIPHNL